MLASRLQASTAALVCTALTCASPVALAAPAQEDTAESPAATDAPAESPAEAAPDEPGVEPDAEPAVESTAAEDAPGNDDTDAEDPQPQPEPAPVTEVEGGDQPQGGGVAGSVVSADDPAAKQAQADLEGEALDRESTDVPARMQPLQTAAWWTMFGAVALATAGGIFSGLAERQEDEAERLALGFDIESGKRLPYEDNADEYEAILDKGNTYQWTSRGFLIGAGVVLATSIALFAVHGKRSKREKRQARLRGVSPLGVEVEF